MELPAAPPIITAIMLSPIRFIRQLLDWARANFEADDGFPTLIESRCPPSGQDRRYAAVAALRTSVDKAG